MVSCDPRTHAHSSERSLSVLRSRLSACAPNTAFQNAPCTQSSVGSKRVSRRGRLGFVAVCVRCASNTSARTPTWRPIELSRRSNSVIPDTRLCAYATISAKRYCSALMLTSVARVLSRGRSRISGTTGATDDRRASPVLVLGADAPLPAGSTGSAYVADHGDAIAGWSGGG